MQKSTSFKGKESLLTGVNSESQQPSSQPLSDAEVDFSSEPNAIPLSSIHKHSEQHQEAEQKKITQDKPDTLEIKTIDDKERELTSDSEPVRRELSIREITETKINSDDLLYDFLHSVGISRADVQQSNISEIHLLKLFQKETSCFSFLQWCSMDHIVEKNLQWLLLRPKDVGESAPESCFRRVRPHGRSILLKNSWGLMKTYAARGFTKGIETSLAKTVHYFIYAMLAYRLVGWLQIDTNNFVKFQDLFQDSNQKGVDTLVTALAKLATQWLKLILVSPVIIGTLQSLISFLNAREVSSALLQHMMDDVADQLSKPSNFCRDTLRETLLPFAQMGSLSSKVQKLDQLVRWDGRLSVDNRRKSFESIRRAAKEAHQIVQLNAQESLAKIVHGVGLKDLPRLQRAGYSKAELLEILHAKTTGLSDLEILSQSPGRSRRKKLISAPRRVYATYLLWWLGLSTSFWQQRLPFSIYKAVKLTAEIYFLQKIAESILEAIHCPDKPGFKFGDGYQSWASDYTSKCFTARIVYFRTINSDESVDALVAEIPQYHLTDLTALDLSSKYLTEEEAIKIIQAVIRQGASLQLLNLGWNYLSNLSDGIFSGLNQLQTLNLFSNQLSSLNDRVFAGLSQLQFLELSFNSLHSLSEGFFADLSQLQTLNLGYCELSNLDIKAFGGLSQLQELNLYNNLLSNLSNQLFVGLSQLQELDLSDNQLSSLSEGLFASLSQLRYLYLGNNHFNSLSDGVFAGLGQLQELYLHNNLLSHLNDQLFAGLIQLKWLSLSGNELSSLNNGVFTDLNQLQGLFLSSNMINTSTLLSVLPFLPTTLLELDISSNYLTSLPDDFAQRLPSSIQKLWVGNNSFIPSVLTPEFMRYFPSTLRGFYIAESDLINITENAFSNFFLLRYLDLSNNQLSNLNEKPFHGLSQLELLALSGNQLSDLSEVFTGLNQLQRLYLSQNQLRDLNVGVFAGLSQLQELYLGLNPLTSLRDGLFTDLSQMQRLFLVANQLSSLTVGTFAGLSQLQDLGLSGNQLSNLSQGVFASLSQLQWLDLNINELGDLAIKNMTLGGFPYQLNSLYLSNNQIGNIQPLAEILSCTNLTSLDLSGNPLNDTSIASEVQQKNLKKFCDDQRCHANLPATESCSVNTHSGSSIEDIHENNLFEVKKITTSQSYGFFSSHSFPHFSPLDLPSLDSSSTSADSLLTIAAAGAMIVGVVGLSLLLYKNAVMVRVTINAGCRLLQRCFYGSDDSSKTSTNSYSFHSKTKTRKAPCKDQQPPRPLYAPS